MSCGVKRRNYRGKSMTLEWLGTNGGTRTTQCNTAFRWLGLVHVCTLTSRDKHMPLTSVITLTWLFLQESPSQMSFKDESLTLLTVSLCPGYTTKKDQESAAG